MFVRAQVSSRKTSRSAISPGCSLRQAARAEYRENEIFPPSDSVEDWLKLLDYEPENVVRVTPVRPQPEKASETRVGKVI